MATQPYILFVIDTGQLFQVNDDTSAPILLGTGYSGNAPYINDPSATSIKGHGPLPVGWYTIGMPEDRPMSVGPFALPLTPDAANVMFDRGSFLFHGNKFGEPSIAPPPGGDGLPRTASDGCIVTALTIRQIIAAFRRLQVISFPETMAAA